MIATQGTPQIKVVRDGVLWARAWWNPMVEDADGDSATLTCAWRGPFAEQEHNHLGNPYGEPVTVTDEYPDGYGPKTADQGQHAINLIFNLLDTNAGRNGLRLGTLITSVTRDREYPALKQVAEAILQLTEIIDPIEFLERPITAITGTDGKAILADFDVAGKGYFGSGFTQPEFQFGPATLRNVLSLTRELGRPINRVRAVGAERGWTSRPSRLTRVEVDTGAAPHLRRELILDLPDISRLATLTEHAKGALRPNPPGTVTWQPDPVNAPQPGTNYALGTACHFLADDRSLQIDTTTRINAIEIDTDENGHDSAHRIETGQQRHVWPVSKIRQIDAQLAAMARSNAGT
jgi:hypothetical protein